MALVKLEKRIDCLFSKGLNECVQIYWKTKTILQLKTIKRKWLTFSFLCLSISQSLLASSWARNEGKFLFITSFTREVSNSNYDIEGNQTATGDYKHYELSNYAELGISEKQTLGYRLSIQSSVLNVLGADQVNTRFSDGDLFTRWNFWSNEGSAMALQYLLRVPIAPKVSGPPEVQDGQVHAELKIQYGKNWYEMDTPIFLEVEPGFRYKLGGLSPQFIFDVTSGITFAKNWMFLLKIFNSIPVKSALLSEDFGREDIQGSLVYKLGEMTSIQWGATKRFAGKNVNNGFAFFASLWASWSVF